MVMFLWSQRIGRRVGYSPKSLRRRFYKGTFRGPFLGHIKGSVTREPGQCSRETHPGAPSAEARFGAV